MVNRMQRTSFARSIIARQAIQSAVTINPALEAAARVAYQRVSDGLTDHEAAGYAPNQRAAAVNNELFHLQAVHRKTSRTHIPLLASVPAWPVLLGHFRSLCAAYLHEHQEKMPVGLPGREFVWCSVHAPDSTHPAHTHDDSLLSAVYYVAVPAWSPPLVFRDGKEHLEQPAIEGDMVVFPSSLTHEVPATTTNELGHDENDVRISISYNLMKRSL